MHYEIVTLFPEMFQDFMRYGVIGRALAQSSISLRFWNPRDYTQDPRKTVDDRPYGGGPGMVMLAEPLLAAIRAAKKASAEFLQSSQTSADFSLSVPEQTTLHPSPQNPIANPPKVIYLSPQGKVINQSLLQQYSQEKNLIFVAGRYEGIDERVIQLEVDEEWSIGDYILTGGELPVMVVLEGLIRLIPGTLGHASSAALDSFSNPRGLLDHPHYTRPEIIEGLTVPKVLRTGDHSQIARWRLKQSLGKSWTKRKSLLEGLDLDRECQALLEEYIQENEHE